ncbi:hypothetical protein [Kitasatospora sp. NPDC086791]|uniref:hypothetical protein n=1 Tax=Kitasatospora sp. NPDC086791 TaxID=3155178 RepID=UPI00341FDCB1
MCLYLLHGSVERIPGLLADPEVLSFEHLSRHVPVGRRAGYEPDDAHRFSLDIKRKVHGRLYGLEFRIYFAAGEAYADAVVPFGAPVALPRLVRHFRGHYASGGGPGDWDFDVYADRGDLRQGVVSFGNRREIWFDVNRRRLDTGRLEGNRFGARGAVPNAGGVMFPDRHEVIEGTSAEARAYRRQVARLYGPLPLRAGRPVRPEAGTRARPRSVS